MSVSETDYVHLTPKEKLVLEVLEWFDFTVPIPPESGSLPNEEVLERSLFALSVHALEILDAQIEQVYNRGKQNGFIETRKPKGVK